MAQGGSNAGLGVAGAALKTGDRTTAHADAAPGAAGVSLGQRSRPAPVWPGLLEAVVATAAMDAATRSAWCREKGLYAAELDAWKRDAIAGLGEPRAASAVEARQDRRRVKELERELHRKDKGLAETAALLVLTKTYGPPRLQVNSSVWREQSALTYPALG